MSRIKANINSKTRAHKAFALLALLLLCLSYPTMAQDSTKTSSGDPAASVLLPEKSVHALELNKYLELAKTGMTTEEIWSRFSRTSIRPPSYSGKQLFDSTEIYGYHPFWMGNAWRSYNFELLSRVGWFAYAVDGKTGKSLRPMSQWENSEMPAEAHKHGCKVDIVAALYGEKEIAAFFANRNAQDLLILNLIGLLDGRADGINLDFQGIPPANKSQFSAFVIRLQERLKRANEAYELRITLPILDWQGVYEFAKYASVVDAFLVMGYDSYGSNNAIAGPASILNPGAPWRLPNLDSCVSSYVDAGLERSKFVLNLPHFGKEWHAANDSVGSDSAFVDAIRPYNFFLQPLPGMAQFDSVSGTAYKIFRGKDVWRHMWWDDSLSLAMKYDFAKRNKLRGVGIWALGYDNGREELWDLLMKKFTPAPPKPGEVIIPGYPGSFITANTAGDIYWPAYDFPMELANGTSNEWLMMLPDYRLRQEKNYSRVIKWLALILLLFANFGLLYVFLKKPWLQEYVFFQKPVFGYLLVFIEVMIAILMLRAFHIQLEYKWILIIALAALFGLSLILTAVQKYRAREVP